jgi:phenylacetic acid degradation operon negative regulatory protein
MQNTQRLILFLFAQAKSLPLKETVEIGRLMGKSYASMRAGINRLARDGMLTRCGWKRKAAQYALSPAGRALANEIQNRFMRIHSIVEAKHSWDGTWTLVSFGIPERIRKRRDEFRTKLKEMGFGQLTGGLWIAPNDASSKAQALAKLLRIRNRVAVAISKDVRFGDEPISSVVSRVWPLAQLNRDYSVMRTRMKSRIREMRTRINGGAPPDSREAFLEIFIVFSEAAELISKDPCLPEELLPPGWLGLEVQDLIHEYFHMLHGLEMEDPYAFLLELPGGLHVPKPRTKTRRT